MRSYGSSDCSLSFGCAEPTSLAWIKILTLYGEFDPGSERTLAAWIRHASRTQFLAFSETEWRKGE